jgi:hypothetical protein
MTQNTKNSRILVIFLLFIFSCNSENSQDEKNESNYEVPEEFSDLPTELKDSLELILDNKSLFNFDPTIDNTFQGKKGAILIIPANSIMDQNGNQFVNKVEITISENYSISDFFFSNLQTVHNDEILVTSGMIYFNATDQEGNQLKINPDIPIRIQIPTRGFNPESKIFTGVRDENGNLNWENIEEPAKTLTPYPIRFLSKNKFPTECSDYYGITTDTISDPYFNFYGSVDDYENTLLATKEFQLRYKWTCWDSVVTLYVNNLEKNLWEIDLMVVDYLIRDSIRRQEWYAEPPKGIDGGAPTQDQLDAHEWLKTNDQDFSHRYADWFRQLADQKLTKVNPNLVVDTTAITEATGAMLAYDALNFGWVNVDYFFKDPTSVKMKIVAQTNSDCAMINLLIPSKNVVLSGIEKKNNTYWFTKEEQGYNKLPKGTKAYIVALGMEERKLTFGIKEEILGDNELIEINLFPTTSTAIRDTLGKL